MCGAVRCGAVWCGLEFSQNHDRTAPHFCGHMCDTMYKMRFEVADISAVFAVDAVW